MTCNVNLRTYQQNTVDAVENGWSEFRKQLVVLPTGGGKTIVFSHLAARRLAQRNQRTLILAHREELIDQAIHKLHAATGVIAQKEKAVHHASLSAPVVVASVQTMIRRLEKWPADHFGLLVADEAHHAVSQSWLQVLQHFDGHANVLGVTATPDRGDQKLLASYFERVAFEVGLFDLVREQYLCPIVVKTVPLEIDLSQVHQQAGDFDTGDLGKVLDPYLSRIAEAILEHAPFRKILAFLPLRATSIKFVFACRAAGLSAMHVDGDSPDRAQIVADFARNKFEVLSNAMLLTEGYDDPSIDCVVVLRPTQSRPLYAQMVGRGTRISPGKQNLLLLDFLWNSERMSLTHPAHLIAKSDEEATAITARAACKTSAGGGDEDLELDLQALQGDVQKDREEKLRKELEANRRRMGVTLSAEAFALKYHQPDLVNFEPTFKWEGAKATDKQLIWIKKAGIDPATVRNKGHASKLLDIYFKTPRLATHAMRWKMRQLGHPDPSNATMQEAREFFANLRTPESVES